MFKLSYWTLGMPAWTNEEFVAKASELGYGAIDIRCADGANISTSSSDEEIETLKKTFASKGVGIASLLAYQKRGNGKEPVTDWDAVAEDLVAHARLAQKLDNVPVRITVGDTDPSTPMEQYLAKLGDATKVALQEVPTSRFMYQNHAGSAKAGELGDLVEAINNPRCGLGYSPDHCYVEREDPMALADRYGPVIQQLHIADRKPLPNDDFGPCWIGDGIVPHGAILETLSKHGFDGWISLKWEKGNRSDMVEGDVVLPHYVDYMKRITAEAPKQTA